MCEVMSLAITIKNYIQFLGLLSGSYVGYKYGNTIKEVCCKKSSLLDSYKKTYISSFFKNKDISENLFFNLSGSITGALTGIYLSPIYIPITLYTLSVEYPEEIKKIKKFINNK